MAHGRWEEGLRLDVLVGAVDWSWFRDITSLQTVYTLSEYKRLFDTAVSPHLYMRHVVM